MLTSLFLPEPWQWDSDSGESDSTAAASREWAFPARRGSGGKGSLRGRGKKGKGPARYQKHASATPSAPSPGASDLPLQDPAWIQQLAKSLIPLIRAELQPQAPPEVEPEAADSPGPDPHAEPYFSPMEYMASEVDLSVGDSRRGWPEGEPEFPGECSHGTDISREALREVTGLLRAKFGFPEPPQQPASPVSRMALKAGLEPTEHWSSVRS